MKVRRAKRSMPVLRLSIPDASRYKQSDGQVRRNRLKIKQRPCIFCGDVHATIKCTKLTEICHRRVIIKTKRVCYNCFGHHKASICQIYDRKSEPETSSPAIIMYSGATRAAPNILLKTAVAPIRSHKNPRTFC